MLEVILLIGLLALWAMQTSLKKRIAALEAELRVSREGGYVPQPRPEDPIFEARPRRAATVRRVAGLPSITC